MLKRSLIYILILTVLQACEQKEPISLSSEDFHASVDKLTEIMVHDIFSPPVASRIYVYPNIAAYEIIAAHSDAYNSLHGQIDDLPKIEASTNSDVNPELAALIAHMDVGRMLILSLIHI